MLIRSNNFAASPNPQFIREQGKNDHSFAGICSLNDEIALFFFLTAVQEFFNSICAAYNFCLPTSPHLIKELLKWQPVFTRLSMGIKSLEEWESYCMNDQLIIILEENTFSSYPNKTTYGLKSWRYIAAKISNALPDQFCAAVNIGTFKNLMSKLDFSNFTF